MYKILYLPEAIYKPGSWDTKAKADAWLDYILGNYRHKKYLFEIVEVKNGNNN